MDFIGLFKVMFMKKIIFLPLLLGAIILSGCSKSPGKTDAKLKLNLSGIASISAGGTSGTILFGKNLKGDSFGKRLAGTEEVLELPNGAWTFYAFTWGSDSTPLNGKVYCGKSINQLSGTETTIAMSLTNANCADAEYSAGLHYNVAGVVRFADLFIEECDDVNSANWYCGYGNQGSALSYRFKFQNYIRPSMGEALFSPEVITSACKKIDTTNAADLMKTGLPVNFPAGGAGIPFVASIEFFLGSQNCDTTDAKGVHNVVLRNGVGAPSSVLSKFLSSTTSCTFSTPDYPVDPAEKKNLCESYYGNWTGSTCTTIPAGISRFAPSCSSMSSGANPVLKHLIALPKSIVCDKYNGMYSPIGGHPFAAGNGTLERPYKICTEWQLNQIGETSAPAAYALSSYKLMNDLDMNKTDFLFPASRPICSGVGGSILKNHHNLNSLDKISSDCTTEFATTGFSGTFFGGNKTIRNARIQAESVTELGFVRKLTGSGKVINLNFKNAEVRGFNQVGLVAGAISGSSNQIANVTAESVDVEASSNTGSGTYVGGIAGYISIGSALINDVHVNKGKIRGKEMVGGLIGKTYGTLKNSHFRGVISTDYQSTGDVGGLVGHGAAGAQIISSFSEGLIDTSLQYSGGIAGKFFGTINEAYSNMIIDSRYGSAAYLAGITADATSATISNVYFDGQLLYSGSGTPTKSGIFVTGSVGTNCYSSFASNPSGCSQITSANFRTSLPTFSVSTNWVFTTGSLPRLIWEQRPCLLTANHATISAQTALGRGTLLSPVIICNNSQFTSMSGGTATIFYRLGDDLNLTSLTPATTLASFNGQLDGDDKIIYGVDMTYAIGDNASGYEGIFRSLGTLATVKKLNFFGNQVNNTAGTNDTAVGLIVGENKGRLENIMMLSNKVSGYTKVGLAVGHNKGVLKAFKAAKGRVSAEMQLGGLVGYNDLNGRIIQSKVDLDILPEAGIFTAIGGVAGLNAGEMDQVHFQGKIKSSTVSTNANSVRAGGIAGFNSTTGTITNALYDNRASIELANVEKIGGLVGENGGLINYSVSLGKVLYSNAGGIGTVSEYFHPLAGFNNGGTISPDVFFLENNIGSVLNFAVTSAACTGDLSPCNVGTTINGSADYFSPSYGGGGELNNLSPVASVSGTTFTYNTGIAYPSSTNLNFYRSYVLSDTSGIRTPIQLGLLSNYCPGGFTASGLCSGGFDIAEMEGDGSGRILNYYLAMMNGQPVPAGTPIWEFSSDDGPRLLQLDD